MTFGKAFINAHRETLAFMLACPLIAMIPVIGELFQHYVEMGLGMYEGTAGAQAAEASPARMQAGMIKIFTLSVIGYPLVRFLAGGRDAAAARTLEPRAAAMFAVVLFIQLAIAAMDLFAMQGSPAVSLAVFAAMLVLTPLLLRWMVAAPLGIWVSPARSAREMLPSLAWAVVFTFTVMLPLMVVHYGLGIGAIFAPDALKWPLLILDSFVVGALAIVIGAGNWIAATRRGPVTGIRAATA